MYWGLKIKHNIIITYMPPKSKTVRSAKTNVVEDSSSSDDADAKVVDVDSASNTGSDSEVQVEPEPVRKNTKKTVPMKKEDTEKKTKTSNKTKKSSRSDNEQEVYADEQNEKPQRPRRPDNSILNFRYENYYDLNDPINTLSITEILRYCTAISAQEGKTALMKTLRNTLQAINSEKSFPEFNVGRPQQFNNGTSFGYNSHVPQRPPPIQRPPQRHNSDRNQEYRNFVD
jgi:hypothetical protein